MKRRSPERARWSCRERFLRPVFELLEPRMLLSYSHLLGGIAPPAGDSGAPGVPALLPQSDTGVSSSDQITNLDNNSAPDKTLRFSVDSTTAGATVTLYADGVPIGGAVASDITTTVTTSGDYDLADGRHAITARQTVPGMVESPDSAALTVTIDTNRAGTGESGSTGRVFHRR